MKPIPEWMRSTVAQAPAGRARLSRARPVRQGVHHFTGLVQALAETPSAAPGNWLYPRDARAKLAVSLILALTATLLSSLPALVWCAGGPVALMVSSGLSFKRFGVFLAGPMLITASIATPATLSVVTPGTPLFSMGPLAVTEQGAFVAARLVVRVFACLSAVYLLTATTRPDRLWRGFRALGTPKLVVMILSMMHRYLELLARTVTELHHARISRTIRWLGTRAERAWMAAGISSLFRRTRALAFSVHLAMWSRGYTGEAHLAGAARWRIGDTFLVGATAAWCLFLLGMP